jgi:putative DNA primase/helicase
MALANRLIVLEMTESFLGREDPTLKERLLAELPGILLWALAGYRRLLDRGRFEMPDSSARVVQELKDLSSPIAQFVAELCRLGEGMSVRGDDLYDAYCRWSERRNDIRPLNRAHFGRNLHSAFPGVRPSRRSDPQVGGVGKRSYYEGIALLARSGR